MFGTQEANRTSTGAPPVPDAVDALVAAPSSSLEPQALSATVAESAATPSSARARRARLTDPTRFNFSSLSSTDAPRQGVGGGDDTVIVFDE
jgi:hypothetical protein